MYSYSHITSYAVKSIPEIDHQNKNNFIIVGSAVVRKSSKHDKMVKPNAAHGSIEKQKKMEKSESERGKERENARKWKKKNSINETQRACESYASNESRIKSIKKERKKN